MPQRSLAGFSDGCADSSPLCRAVDGFAGKKAKLHDAALLNQAGSFVRYSKADWTFPGVSITAPQSDSDAWARFNITDLPGAKTYPVATVSLIFTSQILTERGRQMQALWARTQLGNHGLSHEAQQQQGCRLPRCGKVEGGVPWTACVSSRSK